MSSFFNPKDGDEFEKTSQVTLKRLEEQVVITRLIRQSMEESLESQIGNAANGNASNGNATNGNASNDNISNGHKKDSKPNNH